MLRTRQLDCWRRRNASVEKWMYTCLDVGSYQTSSGGSYSDSGSVRDLGGASILILTSGGLVPAESGSEKASRLEEGDSLAAPKQPV